MDELLTRKELADRWKRDPSYIWVSEKCGFRFIAGRTTMTAFAKFLDKVPNPWKTYRQMIAKRSKG
jgi:hypothetical protein